MVVDWGSCSWHSRRPSASRSHTIPTPCSIPATRAEWPARSQSSKGFENGSPSVLQGYGWNKEVLKAGDKIDIEYWPLRDGSVGGHCEKVTFADGRSLQCPSDLGRR